MVTIEEFRESVGWVLTQQRNINNVKAVCRMR